MFTMKSLIDFININNYNKFNDYLLNYTYEDFLEDPKNVYGDKLEIEHIIESNEDNKDNNKDNNIYRYLELVFDGFFQGNYYDMYNRYQYLLYESLLKSYDPKKLSKSLYNKFKNDIEKLDIISLDGYTKNIRIKFKTEFDNTNKEYISLLNLYNYYESKNTDNIIITLSPRISEDISNKVYEDSKGIVYHICPNYVVDKILKYGLRPKEGKNSKIYKNRVWHPKSVYVIFGSVDNMKEYFKTEINNDKITTEYDDNILNSDEVTILKIDLNKYNRKLKFYKDTLGGKQFIYTKEYIPAFCISLYKENPIKKFIKNLFNSK